ncbi:oxidative stress defense protein [Shewanella gaetbuli]
MSVTTAINLKRKSIKTLLLAMGLTTVCMVNSANVLADELPFAHIETTGSSEISVAADMAKISVEVMVNAESAALAKQASDNAIAQTLKRMQQAGIAQTDIESANLNIRPQYQYAKDTPPKLIAYQASRQMTIKVRQLSQLNQLLDSALSEGINRVSNIELLSSQQAQLVEQARQQAIKDAQNKAASLAKGFDKEIQGVWKIRYYNQHNVRPVVYKMAASEAADVSQSYQQGQVTITDSVEVIFKLKE